MLIAIIRYQTVNTAYTVVMTSGCGPGRSGKQSVMHAPNQNQNRPYAKQFYCVNGPCRSNGQGYWETNGPAGAPEVLDSTTAQVNAFNEAHNTNHFVDEIFNAGLEV